MSRTVLLVVSTLDGTGPGRVLTTLAQQLSDPWEPVLVTTHGVQSSPLIDEARASGVTVEHLGMRAMWDVTGVGRFGRLLRHYRPAVVHTRTIRADLVGRIAAVAGTPVVNNLVNLYPDDSIALHGRTTGQVLTAMVKATRRAARLLVANAEAVAANSREVFAIPPERVRVIYDGVDLSRWGDAAPADLSEIGIPSGERVCLTVARLHQQKGLEDLIAAAEILRSEPSLRMVVAGDGPDRAELQSAIERAALADRVHLLGNRTDIPALLARADIFALPSRFEGLPSAIIEAMAARLPVVAASVGGVAELVDDGVSGWLVPASDPAALATAIRVALAADGVVVGGAGRRRAESMFAAPAMATRFADLYAEVA